MILKSKMKVEDLYFQIVGTYKDKIIRTMCDKHSIYGIELNSERNVDGSVVGLFNSFIFCFKRI